MQREGGVTNPAKAVIPVALSTDLLGKRSGRSGSDRAGRGVEQELERKRAAHHSLTPRPVVGAVARPGSPELARSVEPCLDLGPCRDDQRLLQCSRQVEQRALPAGELELAGDDLGSHCGSPASQDLTATASGPEDAHRQARANSDRAPSPGVVEAWLDSPAHPDAAAEPVNVPHQLACRCKPSSRQQHRVGDPHLALGGHEPPREDVRIRLVPMLDLERLVRGEPEAAAFDRVERGGKDAG